MTTLPRLALLLASASALSAALPAVAAAQTDRPTDGATQAAPVSTLVRQVAIPNNSFKLANGLTVVVHEDR